MVKLKIDGQQIAVPAGTTILDAAARVGIKIPHLCYLKDINEIGACRVCLVEKVGMEKLVTACNTEVEEGVEILTNSPKVREVRRINVELILSDHDCKCVQCVKSGNCTLQKIANDLGIIEQPYKDVHEKTRWDFELPLIREASKCVKCMRCVQICDKVQGLNVWDINGSGYRASVGVSNNRKITEADCALCGQCITHCPVGALRERDDLRLLRDALADPEKITMVQIAPAVRTAWGEGIGISKTEATTGKMVSALRRIGFDYIFDTTYSADLTIMEEGSEFIERFTHKEQYSWPMFTSCCPGWVRFVKTQYPEYVKNLSTAKSPQQMFGAMAKTYIAQKLGINPDKIFSVSIMPCLSKKYEKGVSQVDDAGHGKDVDLVLTTREMDRLIRADNIQAHDLKEEEFDEIFGEGSGAGVIFGATGGVMEAALRSAYFLITGENPEVDSFKSVRGMDGWKEATFEIKGMKVKVAVASGLGNTGKLMEAIKRGEVDYDFVEIMACPGGCVGGGGQPVKDGYEFAEARGEILYGLDKFSNLRFSHENSAVQLTYEEFLGEPNSHRAHQLLHTNLEDWDLEMNR
ncbi:NADH-dependent [FeFe] hydrogenase, group A6 [Anaerovoracaceae bacterium 41-7]|jgi:NADP-reducing hydrogenase subunit HndD|uniref:NADH-dependent [FeFe] hydrogenase, group A6 n=1 Tax=Anaerovoracaceae TaxID=543314 RepID=UPI00137A672A|nr:MULTISPECIES: NADH-dependent [FeFe] hydrogenase, group A6 [Clostridia]MCI9475657.1 4Fe-4S binding protein [Emergencia sp.]MCI9640986.1 4Fe-4S binding protein [Emergencia sp.]NCF00151.1 hydrogenase [Emergencia sp. 1XD21-10]